MQHLLQASDPGRCRQRAVMTNQMLGGNTPLHWANYTNAQALISISSCMYNISRSTIERL